MGSAAEDNLKRLVSEVTRLNREAGSQIDANVIAYYALLLEAEKKSWDAVTGGASMDSATFDAALIARLGQMLSNDLNKKDQPSVCTAALQVMMEVAFKKQMKVVEDEISEHAESAAMLSRSIAAVPMTRSTTVQAYEKLHKLVVEYVCVQSRLDRALSDERAAEEVRAAVDSVFPLSSLARFLTLGEEERLNQISELAQITLGICLYNRHTGNGGHALPPDTQTYMPQAQRLMRDLQRHTLSIQADLKALAAYQAAPDAPGSTPEAASAARARAGEEAVNLAQSFATFQQLSADLGAGLQATEELENEISHMLLTVTEEIGSSAAVQKDVVFPMFDRLGELQLLLNQELRMLVVRQRLYEDAVGMLGGYVSMLPPKQDPSKPRTKAKPAGSGWAGSLSVPSAAEQVAQDLIDSKIEEAGVPPMPEGFEYVEPGASDSSPEAQVATLAGLSLCGFCPASLCKSGLLLPAKPQLGLVRATATGMLFGFASAKGLAEFVARGPEAAVEAIDKAVAQRPILGKVLGRTASVHPTLSLQSVVDIMSGPLKVDFGCQTPTHFVERHIDYSYEWNEWALRRRALALANLRQKRTHSTQTAQTHFKRDGDTQVWLPKESQVQTRVDKGQAMPKKLQYVAGLRGSPNTKMNVIRLELDLGQPHQH